MFNFYENEDAVEIYCTLIIMLVYSFILVHKTMTCCLSYIIKTD
jgi:hypothetical protein